MALTVCGPTPASSSEGSPSPASLTSLAPAAMKEVITPAILYVGTPVVLIGTRNADGSANLAPMSSAWWLGMGCMAGLDASSQTTENLIRTRECVLNLPSASLAGAVDRIAMTTGTAQLPLHKAVMGFRHEAEKFELAGLTPVPSDLVDAPRASECSIQLEAVVEKIHSFGETNAGVPIPMKAFEFKIVRVHASTDILVDGNPNRIDPDKWKPLIMSFRQFYTLGERLQRSTLSEFSEDMFRGRRKPGTVIAART